jgi:hypothetical protein
LRIEASFLTIAVLALTSVASTQTPHVPKKATFVGTWKGKSVCQIAESPCHDELAAYYIENATDPGAYRIRLYKVVQGTEELMGTLDCRSDAAGEVLTCSQNQAALWTWRLTGDAIYGTLTYQGAIYRKINLTRAK